MEYGSPDLEDQALEDAFTFSPQLESTKLLELGEDPQALAKYMGTLSLCVWVLLYFNDGSYRDFMS